MEDTLGDELLQFRGFVNSDEADGGDSTESRMFQVLTENKLQPCFPNVDTLLRIYLAMMVTNCSGERSFLKLKIIKNELRSTMAQGRLNWLSLMSIENQLLENLDMSDVIDIFAHEKSRKRLIYSL